VGRGSGLSTAIPWDALLEAQEQMEQRERSQDIRTCLGWMIAGFGWCGVTRTSLFCPQEVMPMEVVRVTERCHCWKERRGGDKSPVPRSLHHALPSPLCCPQHLLSPSKLSTWPQLHLT